MRAGLPLREPRQVESWEKQDIYQKILLAREGNQKFFLHDGPPFANGDAHMGTALNKILKDFVVKSKSMAGYKTEFIPGWDCHGLPIEYKISKSGGKTSKLSNLRNDCASFAHKHLEIQKESFRRLGVFGEWNHPYLTMDAEYESGVLEVFAQLVDQGLVYQQKKPVLWSYGAETALAEAEVEYQEKESPAIYVLFPIKSSDLNILQGVKAVVWTTTPWTLPANQAIALHSQMDYVLGIFVQEKEEQFFLLAKSLLEVFSQKTGWRCKEMLADFKGQDLVEANVVFSPPFLKKQVPLLVADFVTSDVGTGFVHIAPAHGEDDYQLGKKEGLAVFCPVDSQGRFTSELGVSEWEGLNVFKANSFIISHLESLGILAGQEKYLHSYPHCWRSKTPLIYRAVEQFFISVDSLRDKALKAIDEVEWLPEWGRNRLWGMIQSRGDWCISRQRVWGIPLPAFFSPEGDLLLSADLVKKVAEWVSQNGTQAWFEKDDCFFNQQFNLPEGSRWCGETLDVWIDSGCSFFSVSQKRLQVSEPADLYLEATDQHRGWFQSSLLLSLVVNGKAPYKKVLTHGFVIDKETGKKTSKSAVQVKGKPTDAKYYYEKYGADIVRLWASSVDWKNEVPFGEEVFKQVADTYRRWRNTLRALLGNLSDFSPQKSLDLESLVGLDHWILERLDVVGEECREAYEDFDFQKVYRTINDFCVRDLSHIYIDVMKDRLYCDFADSSPRRATQTAMFKLLEHLCLWMSPILAFSAEEAWQAGGFQNSIHEQVFPPKIFAEASSLSKMEELLRVRSEVQQVIEKSVQSKHLESREQAEVLIPFCSDSCLEDLKNEGFIREFFQVAGFQVDENCSEIYVQKTRKEKCPRCWRFENLEGEFCSRCSEVYHH